MKLTVIGSSSAGNGYILKDSVGSCLILEAGVNIKDVKKALNFKLQGVLGCLVTHRHGDHIKHAAKYMEAGIDIYCGKDNGVNGHRFIELENLKEKRIGPYRVIPFDVEHDVPCFGFLIHHEECGTICFITDTKYCKYRFPGLNNIIIEANYSLDIMTQRVLAGEMEGFLKNRVQESHMSFDTAMEFLEANDLSGVHKVVLVHLSSGNADPVRFQQIGRAHV